MTKLYKNVKLYKDIILNLKCNREQISRQIQEYTRGFYFYVWKHEGLSNQVQNTTLANNKIKDYTVIQTKEIKRKCENYRLFPFLCRMTL